MKFAYLRVIPRGMAVLLLLCWPGADRANRPLLSATTRAQSCTPPLFQGYTSSCTVIPLRWLNRDPISAIDHYEIWRGGVKVGEAPASALGFSDPVGCSFGAVYTIVQHNRNGAQCQTVTTGNPPHSRPCEQCQEQTPGFRIVNAASFTEPVSGGSIAAIFPATGAQFGVATQQATELPLPSELAGVQVALNGARAGLFYVSAGQLNVLLPDVSAGQYQMDISLPTGQLISGQIYLFDNPGIFTAQSTGNGPPAAVVTKDGQNFFAVSANGQPVPISAGTAAQPNYLILFGTGLHGSLQVRLGGQLAEVVWAGRQPSLPGVDQVNVRLPEALAGRGIVTLSLSANGLPANDTVLQIQ
jgi:uncharacterized protein (TIGR03437 family)